MRIVRRMLTISSLEISFFLSVCLFSAHVQADGRQIAGEVVSVSGTVFIRQDGRSSAGPLKPAKGGDSFFAGDVVNTSSNGKVKLLFKDKTVVDLGESALFKVDEYKPNTGTDREVKVNMMYGNLRAAVSQKLTGSGKFQVRTPTATMGVRGTEFVVKSEAPATLQAVRAAVLNQIAPPPVQQSAPGKSASAKTEITVIQGRVDVEQKVADKGDKGDKGQAKQAAPVVLTAGTQLTTKQEDKAPAKPVKLEEKQVQQIAQSVKLQDNTFQKAVLIDTGSKDSGGDATRALLNTAMAGISVPQVTMGQVGFAGTFNAVDLARGPNVNLQPSMRTLTVVIQK